ncbi:sodium/solute symporter [Pelagicoccus sp. NFK12]|uniref:Sodium/solute symporter n=1 Tax=Pelagicoccus enzymogenes TaxID=2773457 RepID=A0A927IIN8_9BACT|nr:sodium/solute symporter [Pelagicoccus enzymogenes]MBD5780690.1 sodium/solute symporter [Pelagicoccus enzymogenes]MDQ8200146.1 sodium/solute symporter [Pelagicoccus enzymogenes]
MNISPLDLSIVLCYFVFVFWITVRVGRGVKDSNDYFLAGRSMRWPMIGASLFATNISAEQFVGQAGLAMAMGVAVANYQMAGVFGFLLMGIIFLPIYIRLGIVTTPQFLNIRYGKESYRFVSIFQILFLAINAVPVSLYAGGRVMQDLFGWESLLPGVLILAVTTGLYAVLGGLRAVVITDFIQMFILLAGGIMVLLFGLNAVGGWDVFTQKIEAYQASEGVDLFSMVRSADDPQIPWTAVVFGLSIHALYYCSVNHAVVQRAMAAKSIHQARMGGLFAALLKCTTIFLIVMPGVVGLMLLKDGFFEVPPESPDQLYASMIRSLLPVGMVGLTLAGLVAALMSSVDSFLCSASSLITLDWYKPMRPHASEREVVVAGRIFGVVLIVSAVIWALWVIPNFKFLFDYLAKFASYSVGGVLACFLGGLLSPIPNRVGGFVTLLFGTTAGVLMWLSVDNAWFSGIVDELGFDFMQMNFLHAGFFLTVASFLVLFVVSFATKGKGQEGFAAARSRVLLDMEATPAENRQFAVWVGIVCVLSVAIYLYFW